MSAVRPYAPAPCSAECLPLIHKQQYNVIWITRCRSTWVQLHLFSSSWWDCISALPVVSCRFVVAKLKGWISYILCSEDISHYLLQIHVPSRFCLWYLQQFLEGVSVLSCYTGTFVHRHTAPTCLFAIFIIALFSSQQNLYHSFSLLWPTSQWKGEVVV